jgi:hypothetical protein
VDWAEVAEVAVWIDPQAHEDQHNRHEDHDGRPGGDLSGVPRVQHRRLGHLQASLTGHTRGQCQRAKPQKDGIEFPLYLDRPEKRIGPVEQEQMDRTYALVAGHRAGSFVPILVLIEFHRRGLGIKVDPLLMEVMTTTASNIGHPDASMRASFNDHWGLQQVVAHFGSS